MTQSFVCKLENMEVRMVKEEELDINGKIFRFLNIHFDDEEGERLIFKDRMIENKEKYQRGKIGTLKLTISNSEVIKTAKNGKPYIAEKTTITIKDFKENE